MTNMVHLHEPTASGAASIAHRRDYPGSLLPGWVFLLICAPRTRYTPALACLDVEWTMNRMADEPSVTELIHLAEDGDAEAADQLFATMYPELRRLARARLRAGGRNTLLDTSSLVHDSYLRFAGPAGSGCRIALISRCGSRGRCDRSSWTSRGDGGHCDGAAIRRR